MPSTPFIRLVLLTCAAGLAACGDAGSDGSKSDGPDDLPTGNTEVNLLIADPNSTPDELAFNVDTVGYRIVCPESGNVPFDDSVDISGNFEIIDGTDPPIWQMVADLPVSFCSMSMWVFNDDEIVCSGTEALTITEDGDPTTVNQFNLVLVCSLSVNPPTGDIDVNGDFDFVVGNSCPQLIWMNAVPSTFGPGDPPVSAVEVYSFDPDLTCGNNCDPQVCDFSSNPPVCTPGPDLGQVTTFSTASGEGTFADPNAASTTYTCDPAFPGPTEICVTATDGDVECDQVRCATIECP
ncbi:MAG: hypothetical protein AAF500_05145 [Myxococcota bacterium]